MVVVLPGAVGTEEAVRRARLHREREVDDPSGLAVVLGQSLALDHACQRNHPRTTVAEWHRLPAYPNAAARYQGREACTGSTRTSDPVPLHLGENCHSPSGAGVRRDDRTGLVDRPSRRRPIARAARPQMRSARASLSACPTANLARRAEPICCATHSSVCAIAALSPRLLPRGWNSPFESTVSVTFRLSIEPRNAETRPIRPPRARLSSESRPTIILTRSRTVRTRSMASAALSPAAAAEPPHAPATRSPRRG